MTSARLPRLASLALTINGGLFIALVAAFAVAPASELVRRIVSDDGLFYLVLARNAAHGAWSSFDGVDLTNGYHPLWFLLLTPVAAVVSGTAAFFKASLVLCSLLYGASAVCLYRSIARCADSATASLVVALFVWLFVPTGWYLTEAAIATLFTALFLSMALGLADGVLATRGQLLFGALAGAAVLARLDVVFIVAPVLLATAPSRWWGDRRLALVACALVVVPYLVSNLALHGHLVPISGALKSSFPHPTVTNLPLTPGRWFRIAIPIALAGACLTLLAVDRRRAIESRPTLIAANAGVLLFAAYELLFQRDAAGGLWSWHFAVPTYATLLSAGVVASLTPTVRRGVGVVAVVVAIATAVMLERRLTNGSAIDPSLSNVYDAALWMHDHVPAHERIAATDPGIIAYFGERPTVNLDGLINNFAYQQILRDHRLADYLTAQRVAFVCVKHRRVPLTYDAVDVYFPADLYDGAGDTLTFKHADEVFRTADGDVVIWRVSSDHGPRLSHRAALD